MPFWRRNKETINGHSKEKINYKSRLEHKQYLAQESPDLLYDLSDCGLKSVPSGVYSRIKVLRKQALLLQENELTSLSGGGHLSELSENLVILDLHSNCFEKLPEELGLLKNLQKLYLHHNRLKRIPDSIGQLKRLDTLNLSHNCLKQLPSSIGDCSRLKSIELQENPKLFSLPKEICFARGIETLTLDEDRITYPSKEIMVGGVEAIMKFLSLECDIDYIPSSEYTPPPLENSNGVHHPIIDDPYDSIIKGNLKLIEKQKEVKNEQIRALEKVILDTQEREKNMAEDRENCRKKLIESMVAEDAKRDEKIAMLHSLKEQEKSTLNKSLQNAENCTDSLISELVKTMNRVNPQKFLEEMEAEKKEMEELFTIKAGEVEELRQKDVLSAMQQVIEEEMKREELRNLYEAGKQNIISSALHTDSENEKVIQGALQSKGKHQEALVTELLQNEEYQRNAFSTMYIQQDNRTREISNRMEHIQSELASLTMIEMTKRDMKVEFEHDLMSEKRVTLTNMLITLMNQKEEREKILHDRLVEIETRKEKDQENYWLIQYQKLLDSKPKKYAEAETNIEPELMQILESAGAESYAPILSAAGITTKQLSYMSDKELLEAGIHDSYLRKKILITMEEHSLVQSRLASKTDQGEEDYEEPSAPPDEDTPSAPPASEVIPTVETFQSNECVICLENKCNILFLPCGHVCSCWKCETNLKECPLCREPVKQKVRL